MANFEINEEQAALIRELRKLETSDPVHADVYNALFGKLINNDAFLERLANKMIEKSMLCHVLDSVNTQQILAADVGPQITKITDGLQKSISGLNTDLGNKLSKYYSDSFENNPPSGLSINEWDAGWILAKAYNDNAVEFKSHWFEGLMMRKRNNGTWSAYEKVLTDSDLANRLVMNTGSTGIQSPFSGSTSHRLQIGMDGGVTVWKTTDGGTTWNIVKNL